ncbi:unnamed protein product [Brassicogethes aeneus]|uniref:Uncharacterized protein n=1 Tax=Brassicogethes aeneus TaxID=1431903 RepID=A0A9P0BB51_BRAAE|nr:unnamed protein product [Brassicogethes aeneus]
MDTSGAAREIPFSNEEALALFLDLKLSKAHETGATVKLQSLLDHTATRIVKAINEEDVSKFSENLELIGKWGCDGSSGQAQYKQAFLSPSQSDSHMFMCPFVPIQIKDDQGSIFWTNKQPSSTKFCRPISFEYVKETPEVSKKYVEDINGQILNLQEFTAHKDDKIFRIKYNLLSTMVDGKVVQVMTNTSLSACCPICKASPKDMNILTKISQRTISQEALQYGLSSLHAWIRFMECILHVAYKIQIKCWSARTEEHKLIKNKEKQRIQEEFRTQTGLLIDMPKQGSGNTNDGNNARRFFEDPELTASITKVDVELIRRFATILKALASGREINGDMFEAYAMETAELFVSLYNWFYMPSSVHKILIHGRKFIEHFYVPIGQLSEEAQEARNKDYKSIRESHTRKISRKATNEDLINLLLATSDPVISAKRVFNAKKNNSTLDVDVLKLLI